MKTRLLKKLKKRYVYTWLGERLIAWDKKKDEEVTRYQCTHYWLIRSACGLVVGQKYLSRIIWRASQR
jgi:hypothetical protein